MDVGFEGPDGLVDAATDLLAGEVAEPAFHDTNTLSATAPQLTAAQPGGRPSDEDPAADGGTVWRGTAA